MASQHKIECGPSTTVAAVDFGLTDSGVGLAVAITTSIEGVDQPTADRLAALAHDFCPYSKATRGNIDVSVTAVSV
jgi:lipoyl-dependent peroxiredoxin